MTTEAALPPATGTAASIRALRSRPAGYSVARKCLEIQGGETHVLKAEAVPWYQGTLGELQVGRMLAQLGPEWLVLHSVPFGTTETDIDHLVIGPPGVFTLNTKHHAGKRIGAGDRVLWVNGFRTDHIRDSLSEATRAADRLRRKTGTDHHVTPVIVVVGATSITMKRASSTTVPVVIGAHQLVPWLRGLTPSSSQTEVDLVKLAAEEPDTWHVDPHAAESLRDMQRFERLHAAQVAPGKQSVAERRRRPRSRVLAELLTAGVMVGLALIGRNWLTAYLASQTP